MQTENLIREALTIRAVANGYVVQPLPGPGWSMAESNTHVFETLNAAAAYLRAHFEPVVATTSRAPDEFARDHAPVVRVTPAANFNDLLMKMEGAMRVRAAVAMEDETGKTESLAVMSLDNAASKPSFPINVFGDR